LPFELGWVEVELDDRDDAEVARVLHGASAAAASHRGAPRDGDLGSGSADVAETAVDEDRLPRLELPFIDQGLEGGGPNGWDRGGLFE
jgi:hypothetical protein